MASRAVGRAAMSKQSKKKARRAAQRLLRDVEDELGRVAQWVRSDAEAERRRMRAELATERATLLGHARAEAHATRATAQAEAREIVAVAGLEAERLRGRAALEAERARGDAALEAERTRGAARAAASPAAYQPSSPFEETEGAAELRAVLADARGLLDEMRVAVRRLAELQTSARPGSPWEPPLPGFPAFVGWANGGESELRSPRAEPDLDRRDLEEQLFSAVEVPSDDELPPRKRRRWARAHRPSA